MTVGRGKGIYALFKEKAFVPVSIDSLMKSGYDSGSLKKVLGPLDLAMIGVGGIIGAGVFVLTGEVARNIAGPSIILSYLISSLASLFSAMCYVEFAVDIPLAGGSFNYLAIVYGQLIAWLAGITILCESTIGVAAVSKGFSGYLASFLGMPTNSLVINTGFLNIDILAFMLVIFLCIILAYGMKESSLLNIVISTLNILVIVFIILAAIPHADADNFDNFFPMGTRGMLEGAGIIFYAYLGFDSAASAAEETKNPGYDLPLGIIGSLAICTFLYVFMSASIISMVPNEMGRKIVSLGALLGIITSVQVGLFCQARLYMTMGRSKLIPSWTAKLSKSQAPVNASIITAVTAGVFSLFFELKTLSEMVSMGTFVVMSLVSLGVIQRQYHQNNDNQSFVSVGWRMVLLISVCILEGISFTYKWNTNFTIFLIIVWFIVTCSFLLLPVKFCPNKFNVPFKPFFPSIAVFANIHLMFSLGWQAHLCFFIIQILGVLVYIFYGQRHENWQLIGD